MRKTHQDDVRAKIQTSQLLNRLQDHALGTLELSTSQIKAIEVLIRKTLPDLQAIAYNPADDQTALALAGRGHLAWNPPQ
jgi:hypothetical protein